MTLQRLLPTLAPDIELAEQLEALRPWEDAPAKRPRVLSNFALTVDGKGTIDGTSGAIGSETDVAMLVGLRTRIDAVLIGAGTMRAERYGRVIRDPAKRERREAAGLAGDALLVIVSGRLELPWDAPAFTDGGAEIVIFTASDDDPPDVPTPVQVCRHDSVVDLAEALRWLRAERGVRSVLCEGGPHLHADLLQAGLLDELFITHAPKIAGGEGPSLFSGLPAGERRVELEWLLHEPASGELFARYSVLS